MKHEGSCLCGTVRWGIDGALSSVAHCHCSMCRKAHGTAFGTYADAERSALRWLAGEAAITRYVSSPGTERGFCSRCGSVVPEAHGDSLVFVPLGCMDGANIPPPTENIFVASRAPWYTITDTLPQHDAYTPGVDARPVERPNPEPVLSAQPGTLHGSCLCGAVAYEVSTPLTRVHHCHCGRCRKASSSAHATIGFTAANGLTFTRGEAQLQRYKLPEAKYFAQTFCSTCGSAMPRVDRDRDITVIPLGSLDDNPDRSPDAHIFVASKAPWYAITDDVPQFDERD